MKIAFVTFGCRLNHAEALEEEAAYLAAGHDVVPLDESAAPDLIVVRGCSVTARAQRDCEKKIAALRGEFSLAHIRIVGCLPSASREAPPPPSSSVPMRTSRAYLKVQDGCSCNCAFCIVPQFRGRPSSTPLPQILARARAFISAGFRELVVTGCNLALYRDGGTALPALLSELASLPSPTPHRIRLGSLEPGICDNALIDAFAAHPNLCRFLHLSLQSASNHVLQRMNRPYTIETVDRFCQKIRQTLGPRFTLGADIISGFPGETDADHQLTLDFLSRHNFTHLHVFPYSERPNTPAATMPFPVERALRLRRAHEIEHAGKLRHSAYARSFIGRTVQVCVECGGDHGWTSEYLPCRLSTPAPRRSLQNVVYA